MAPSGIYIPANDSQNQYVSRDDCNKFSSLRFDQGLVRGKLTRQEVDDMLHRVHSEVGNFRGNSYICCFCTLIGIFFLGMWFWNIITNNGDDSFVMFLFMSLIGGMGSVSVCPCILAMKNTKYQRKIQALFDKENINFWHSRNIHMKIGANLTYIHIMFNFNAETGQ